MKNEQRSPSDGQPAEPQTDDLVADPEPDKDRSLHAWLKNLKHRQDGDRKPSPHRSTQDRVRPLFLGVVGVVVVIVVLLGMLSTPISVKRQQQVADRPTPNLGKPQSEPPTAEADKARRSVTPLLRAEVQSERDTQRDLVAEKDLQSSPNNRSSAAGTSATPAPAPTAPKALPRPASLGQIEFSDGPHGKRESLVEVEARIARLEGRNERNPKTDAEAPKSLDKASLVYVHGGNNQPAQRMGDATALRAEVVNETPLLSLPAGTRLLARLQSTITTAVTPPVVATVEVNYERHGVIVVPAGAKAFGKIEQANSSGHVNVAFDEIQTADGSHWKIEGISQALDFGPLKGKVEGRKGMARFVTRTITGVGVVAAQAVGLRGGLNGPINNSILVRDRLATNIAQAGEQQVQQLALNTNLAVTVPASTRFYVVLRRSVHQDSSTQLREPGPDGINALGGQALTQAELRELRGLRQEFLRLMQLAAGGGHGAETSNR